jgi:hypothetical protein
VREDLTLQLWLDVIREDRGTAPATEDREGSWARLRSWLPITVCLIAGKVAVDYYTGLFYSNA